MNFQAKTEYTITDLKNIAGDNYTMFLSSPPAIAIPSYSKQIIYSFSDFDSNTKQVYQSLYSLISSLNPDKPFFLFAVGERVDGTWKTDQEIEQINSDFNLQLSKSPYSYTTTAINLPISSSLPENVLLNQSNNTHRVIIPPPQQ